MHGKAVAKQVMSNQTKYNSFRQTFPEFVYESYLYDVQSDGLHIVFTFRIGNHTFQPSATIPSRGFLNFDVDRNLMDRLVFNIGMIELISYWKCFCPPRVVVQCGGLAPAEVDFWRRVYFNGLGEFFYINGIEATMEDFMEIVCTGRQQPSGTLHARLPHEGCYLVPVGGGKDSVVTLELMAEAAGSRSRTVPLIMNPRGATVNCIKAAGYTMEDVLVIHRTIHPHLLELNAEGCLNGHTPFSAMLAFYTLLAAALSGIPNIALSNEASANEATVAATGVNHQYSKSKAFEDDFRNHAATAVGTGFNYFSFLRPLAELQIAMLFSREPKYFDVFRSCNAGSKEDRWCGKCAKCLFAYIILSPFIAPERLNAIFGHNLLDDPQLAQYFTELTGHGETKPFECVGTVDEVNTALSMTIDRWYGAQRPLLLQHYVPQTAKVSLTSLSADHNLSPLLFNKLNDHVQAAAMG